MNAMPKLDQPGSELDDEALLKQVLEQSKNDMMTQQKQEQDMMSLAVKTAVNNGFTID